jgi:hypothetical protein
MLYEKLQSLEALTYEPSYREFLEIIGKPHSEATKYMFECVLATYLNPHNMCGLMPKDDLYQFWKCEFINWYSWVDKPEIDSGVAKNSCRTVIPRERAVQIIYENLGFDKALIKIAGAAYYDAIDWNYIRFEVADRAYVFKDDELHKVWR